MAKIEIKKYFEPPHKCQFLAQHPTYVAQLQYEINQHKTWGKKIDFLRNRRAGRNPKYPNALLDDYKLFGIAPTDVIDSHIEGHAEYTSIDLNKRGDIVYPNPLFTNVNQNNNADNFIHSQEQGEQQLSNLSESTDIPENQKPTDLPETLEQSQLSKQSESPESPIPQQESLESSPQSESNKFLAQGEPSPQSEAPESSPQSTQEKPPSVTKPINNAQLPTDIQPPQYSSPKSNITSHDSEEKDNDELDTVHEDDMSLPEKMRNQHENKRKALSKKGEPHTPLKNSLGGAISQRALQNKAVNTAIKILQHFAAFWQWYVIGAILVIAVLIGIMIFGDVTSMGHSPFVICTDNQRNGTDTSQTVIISGGGDLPASQKDRYAAMLAFMNLPLNTDFGVPDNKAEQWFLATKTKIISVYGLNSSNIQQVTAMVKAENIAPMFFYAYAAIENSQTGNTGFLNHFSDSSSLTPFVAAQKDAHYLYTYNNGKFKTAATGGGAPSDMPTADANIVGKGLADHTFGEIYLQATAAVTMEVEAMSGHSQGWDTSKYLTSDFRGPIQHVMTFILKLGGKIVGVNSSASNMYNACKDIGTSGGNTSTVLNTAISIACSAESDKSIPAVGGSYTTLPPPGECVNYVKAKKAAWPTDNVWASCDRGTATVIKISGIDESIPVGATGAQYSYLKSSPKWKYIGDYKGTDTTTNNEKMQPGDIVIVPGGGPEGHIKLYLGTSPAIKKAFPHAKDTDNMYAASLGDYYPWIYTDKAGYDPRTFAVFHCVQPDNSNKYANIFNN